MQSSGPLIDAEIQSMNWPNEAFSLRELSLKFRYTLWIYVPDMYD